MKRLWEEIEGVNYPRSDIPFQIAEYTPGLSLEEVVWPENVFLTRPPIRKFEVTIIGASMIAELEPAIFEIPSPSDIELGKIVEGIDLKRKQEELGLTIADFIRQLRPCLVRYRDSAQGGTEPDERFTEQWIVGQNDLCEVQLSLDPIKYVPLSSVADAQDGDASSAEAQESKRPRKWGKEKRPHKDTQTAIKFDFVIGPRWEFKMVLGSRYELGDGWHGGEADLEGIEEDVWGWPLVRGPRMRRRVGT